MQSPWIKGVADCETRDREIHANKGQSGGTESADQPGVDQTAEDLKDRTKQFAVLILELADGFPQTPAGQTLARQLIRAGSGVAGNYRSACRARSHKEFTSRLGVVLEEVDEAELWLDIISERRIGRGTLRARLLDESRQLRAIFSRAYLTARRRDGDKF